MKWKVNEAALKVAGLGYMQGQGSIRIIHPLRSDVIDLRVTDGVAEILIERSSGHRAVAEALGLTE